MYVQAHIHLKQKRPRSAPYLSEHYTTFEPSTNKKRPDYATRPH